MIHAGEKLLEERVRRLEADVEGQAKELQRLRMRLAPCGGETLDRPGPVDRVPSKEALGVRAPDARAGAPPEESPDTTGTGAAFDWRGLELPFELANLRRWEWWLNKVGIALFLLGVVFLFKFSWDRGWLQVLLTPAVRVGLGIALGSALVWVGLRVYAGRRAFAQVVLGGGIGTYYITGFAAFQMLGVFSYPVAFTFMAAVTLLAFALALRQGGAALAVVGVSGGFATPFLLYDGGGAVGGLVVYAGLVLAGAMGTYFYKGWRALLLVSFGGYWILMSTATMDVVSGGTAGLADRLAVQVGVIMGWVALWLVPAAREALRAAHPTLWRVPEVGGLFRDLFGGDRRFVNAATPAHLLSFASPLVALWMTQGLWDPGKTTMGLVALGVAACHGLAWERLRRVGGSIAYLQTIVALLAATLALTLLLVGETLLVVLAVEAAALHFVARRRSDRVVAGLGHALFAGVGAWAFSLLVLGTVDNLFDPYRALPFVNTSALAGIVVIALAFASSVAVGSSETRRAYRTLAHGAVALLLLRELVVLGGDWYAPVGLALYAVGLHLLSRRRPEWGTRGGAHALVAFVALWLYGRLAFVRPFPEEFGWSVFGPSGLWGLADLVMVAAILASSWIVEGYKTVLVYRVAAHAGLLAWLWREFGALPGSGDAYITLAWGLCGAAMFVAGLRRDHGYLIKGGVATLFLVVAKLFLWDLAGLDPLWRVLLFLGFGGLFLLLSYHLRNLWKPGDAERAFDDVPDFSGPREEFPRPRP